LKLHDLRLFCPPPGVRSASEHTRPSCDARRLNVVLSPVPPQAAKVFEESLSAVGMLDRTWEDFRDKREVPSITWALRNGLGLACMNSGLYAEADIHLKEALTMCEHLAEAGLAQDAYADVAGCMNDYVVNSLRGGLHDPKVSPKPSKEDVPLNTHLAPLHTQIHAQDQNMSAPQKPGLRTLAPCSPETLKP
jgi:hypothetical protein